MMVHTDSEIFSLFLLYFLHSAPHKIWGLEIQEVLATTPSQAGF